jgi:hypothetical protein
MIKLKNLLTEAGLKDMEPNLPQGEHGFDLTDFKPGGFRQILKALAATDRGTKMKRGGIDVWRWTGMRPYAGKRAGRVTLYTKNNPITGQPSGEKDYASHMVVVGHKSGVQQLVKFIKQYASEIKGESPGRSDYI